MSRRWKVLLAVAVAAPMLAYVAGTLATAREPLRTPDPVVLVEESTAVAPQPARSGRPTPRSRPSRPADDDDQASRVVLPRVIDVDPDDRSGRGGGDDDDDRDDDEDDDDEDDD